MSSLIRAALFCTAVCAALVNAQITLTSNDYPTTPGTTVNYGVSNSGIPVNVGSGGAGQTWNFSGITTTTSEVWNWVTPASTPFGNQFPTANRAVQIPEGTSTSYGYYNWTSSSLTLLGVGIVSPDCTVAIPYTNPQPFLIFPITMGTQWNWVFQFSSSGVTIVDSTHNVVDGWGTLVDVAGSYPCLRIQSHSFTHTYYSGFPVFADSTWSYVWAVQNRGPQVQISAGQNETNPNFTTGELTRIVSVTGVSPLPEPAVMPSQMELGPASPNPFNSSTVLTFTLPQSGDISLSVFDAAGREVSTLARGRFLPGAYQVNFDGFGLPSGTYFARLVCGGRQTTRSLTLLK